MSNMYKKFSSQLSTNESIGKIQTRTESHRKHVLKSSVGEKK